MQENRPFIPQAVVKARARMLSLRFFWRLIAASLILLVFQYLLNMVVQFADVAFFGRTTEIVLAGVNVSVSYELMALAVSLLWAPVSLGVSAFFLSAARGDRESFASIFEWFGDPEKRRVSLKFGLYHIVFSAVTFPISSLPLYYLNDRLGEFMEKLQTNLSLDPSAFLTREVRIALVMLLLYGLVALPFIALPYVLCDLYPRGFFKCLRYAVRLVLNYVPRILLFILSFALLAFISSFIIFLMVFLAIYFRVALICMLDSLRVATAREPYFGKYADASPDNERPD